MNSSIGIMHVRPIIVSTLTSMNYVSLLGFRCLFSEVGKIYTLITFSFNFLFTRDNVKDLDNKVGVMCHTMHANDVRNMFFLSMHNLGCFNVLEYNDTFCVETHKFVEAMSCTKRPLYTTRDYTSMLVRVFN
jgi:hypothetical protein